jgi:glycosyltransferase involved in cell wall biosynthesis
MKNDRAMAFGRSGDATDETGLMNQHVVKYRFGFILSTSLGNMTRYMNFRKFAELDHEIDFVWAPVKHYFAPGEHNPFRRWPQFLQRRATVVYQSAPVLRKFGTFDAVMIHLYEIDVLTALRGYFFSKPLRIISADDAPASDPTNYPFHPVELAKPAWRRAVRLRIDLWRARRADLLIPFSNWAGDLLTKGAGVSQDRVKPVHVGLDLSVWQYLPRTERPPKSRVRILFVGGEFFRKGGADLLEVFINDLSAAAELHIVTKTRLVNIPKNVHNDMNANDSRLADLYQFADILVHPTRSDLSSWVVLEAMASGCAVITTPVGGITDLVIDSETGFLVRPGKLDELANAIEKLVNDPLRRRAMSERARKTVERDFNAEVNVPKILRAMKECSRDAAGSAATTRRFS